METEMGLQSPSDCVGLGIAKLSTFKVVHSTKLTGAVSTASALPYACSSVSFINIDQPPIQSNDAKGGWGQSRSESSNHGCGLRGWSNSRRLLLPAGPKAAKLKRSFAS